MLALASVLSRSELPAILIDCGAGSPASDRFESVLRRWPGRVTIQHSPVMSHGEILDRLFTEVDAEIMLCVDSDAELLTDSLVPGLLTTFEHPEVFGAGFRRMAPGC